MNRSGPLFVASLLACALPASADTIHLVDASPIEDVDVQAETVSAVTYEEDGRLESVPSDRVERVEYDRLPRALDEAENYVRDGDLAGGLETMVEYVREIQQGGREREEWAPAYAARRIIDLGRSLGDLQAVKEFATWLIEAYPESRHVPAAYLATADAQARLGELAKANSTLQDLERLITERGLSDRWRVECDLALVLTDPSLTGQPRRDRLSRIATTAGDQFPGARNRAQLALAESFVREAVSSAERRAQLLARAKDVFQGILDDDYASDDVLAGAYTGLGDCLFYGRGEDEERLIEAGMKYMRVVVLFPEQSQYVAKAMFYAGRSFDQLEDPDHKFKARRLYRSVLSEFPESDWAAQARNFL